MTYKCFQVKSPPPQGVVVLLGCCSTRISVSVEGVIFLLGCCSPRIPVSIKGIVVLLVNGVVVLLRSWFLSHAPSGHHPLPWAAVLYTYNLESYLRL